MRWGMPPQLAGLSLAQARRLAEGLAGLGVLVEHGSTVAFAHPIVRNALYRDLTAGSRESLHAEAVQMLTAAAPPRPRSPFTSSAARPASRRR